MEACEGEPHARFDDASIIFGYTNQQIYAYYIDVIRLFFNKLQIKEQSSLQLFFNHVKLKNGRKAAMII